MDDCERERSALYAALFDRCPTYRLPAPLDFLAIPDFEVRACPRDAAELLSGLRRDFADEALVQSGVARRDEQGRLVLADSLSDPTRPLVALRSCDGDAIYEILTHSGCLGRDEPPLIAALRGGKPVAERDERPGDPCSADQDDESDVDGSYEEEPADPIYLALSIEGVVASRACGLDATLATGCDDLAPRHVAELAAACDWESSSDDDSPRWAPSDALIGPRLFESETSRQLVIVGWSPAQLLLGRPEAFVATVEGLRRTIRLMDYVAQLFVWEPDSESLERLAYRAQHQDGARFRAAIRESAERRRDADSLRLGQPRLPMPAGHDTMAGPMRRLYGTNGLGGGGPVGGSDDDKQGYVRRLGERIVQPLVEQAEACSDPQERATRLALANVCGLIHLRTTGLTIDLTRGLVEPSRSAAPAASDKRIDEILSLIKAHGLLTKEAERCRKAPTILSTTEYRVERAPRLPDSG